MRSAAHLEQSTRSPPAECYDWLENDHVDEIQPKRNLEVNVVLVRIGRSTDVPAGQMRVFDVAGTTVNVASADGHLYAFDDTCTHTGCSLAKGELDGTTVTCACHGSQFDVTSGAVLRGPAKRPVRSRLVKVEGENLLAEA
jgi:3-phenylpropionate/trans-cinnamate dioxygenase ferredoxin subunit